MLPAQGWARGGQGDGAGGQVARAAVEGQVARAEAAGDPHGRGAARCPETLMTKLAGAPCQRKMR